jgi:3-oxoacyl-[acyl-carrier-protein] synthase-3
MAILGFSNIQISGISSCVPENKVENISFATPSSENDIVKTIKMTGISYRRIAEEHFCASDLCFEAAEKLLGDLCVERGTIDMLLFVSQTPDYRIPATAPILQDRLKLKKTVAAFDINLGCSGYVYGLSTAFLFANQSSFNRVLLLVGDTLSKCISSQDKATSLLFGDAGTATLIEKSNKKNESYFILGSDGAGNDAIKIKAGGYRYPRCDETHVEKDLVRSEELVMNGADVFNFTIREVPGNIKALLNHSKVSIEDIDHVVFHQSNEFIINFLAKKLKLPKNCVPVSLAEYGNTAGASIPLTIVTEMKQNLSRNKHTKTILCGYGVGLSWGSVLVDLKNCHVSDLVEV